MKTNKTILLPLLLGLSLAGCTRSETDSKKLSSIDQPDANKSSLAENTPSIPPAAATANSTATNNSTATDIASVDSKSANTDVGNATPAQTSSADRAQVATANTTPAADEAKTASNSSQVAADTPAMTPAAPAPAAESPTAPASSASTEVASADNTSKPAVADRIAEWKLASDDIKDEVQNGRVVRSRAPGANEPTGSMDNVLVGQITGKLQGDSDIAALNLDVSTNNGVVTLNGTAHSLDQIGKAMALALDTGGVTQVVSTVKLETTP